MHELAENRGHDLDAGDETPMQLVRLGGKGRNSTVRPLSAMIDSLRNLGSKIVLALGEGYDRLIERDLHSNARAGTYRQEEHTVVGGRYLPSANRVACVGGVLVGNEVEPGNFPPKELTVGAWICPTH